MQLIKRWSIYIAIFVVAILLTDQYREYRQEAQQLQELREVRKDILLQEERYKEKQRTDKQQQKNCLKNALYYEARSEGKLGILAVASVIENRKNSTRYPNDYCSVINQNKQFSYTLEGKPDVEAVKTRLRAADKEAYIEVSKVAQKMTENKFEPVLHHSVMWYAKSSVRNYWTKTKKVVARIGDHVFYKEKQKK